ncbi:MAG: Rha family transcriptional regulator [Desulfovibrio sp.]|nr:Rha family transcriptional regulator [Desulfovibrio sp.]
MADTTVSQLAPIVKENNGIRFESLNGIPAVLSTEVARHFQKRHSHILRDIERLRSILPKSFNAPNFGPVDQTDAKGEKRRAFLLTRDALSLLVMGMTGKAAIMWKLRYIEAFNQMEARLQGSVPPAALPVAEEARLKASYLDGLREGRRLAARADRLRLLERVLHYRRMGLSLRDIGKLMGVAHQRVADLLGTGRASASPCRTPRRWPMSSEGLHPADLLTRAAARIRWQQRLLCGLPEGAGLELASRDARGLYFTLEDIFEDITAALRRMEEENPA